tara:strand:- start:889 stop:1044 length:156 start_codon:yes stop_codon:yes gene_type:complete
MTRWGDIGVIGREEHKRLLDEIERLRVENKQLREFVDKFQRNIDKTARMYE